MAESVKVEKKSHERTEERGRVPEFIKDELYSLEIVRVNHGNFTEVLWDKFSKSDNPHLYVANLIFYAGHQFQRRYIILCDTIIVEFNKWMKHNKISRELELEYKRTALDTIMGQKNGDLIQSTCTLFDLKEDIASMKSVIDAHISKSHFKQACYAIAALNLQSCYTFEEILYPLLFQDMRLMIDLYLCNQPDLQLEFVRSIDQLCGDRKKLDEAFLAVKSKCRNKFNQKNPKCLRKILTSLASSWGIPIDECTNLMQSRSYGAMNYLIYKRYTEHSMNDASWIELIIPIVKDSLEVQKELLERLVIINQSEMALHMAEKLGIEPAEWPEVLGSYANEAAARKSEQSNSGQSTEEPWDVDANDHPFCDKYLQLRLSESDIIMVDDLEKFEECFATLLETYDVLGIDAEWRPSLGLNKETLSLMQIATWDNVYLLDMLALSKCLKTSHWENLIDGVICSPKVYKLGYGVMGDLKLLTDNFIDNAELQTSKFVNVLDLGSFYTELTKRYPQIVPFLHVCESENDSRGLSGLCYAILGKSLSKLEQFSDWERRPLRKSQILYAALDAYCSLQIYEKLHFILSEMSLNLDDEINNFVHQKEKSSKKKACKKVEEPLVPTKMNDGQAQNVRFDPKPITEFRAVVDNAYYGLGKHLRVRGADIIIMDSISNFSDCIKIAQSEGRCFLSNIKRCSKAMGYLPEYLVFSVPATSSLWDQAAAVCKHFNLLCTEEAIFTRCTLCNCQDYMRIETKDMELLWSIRKTSTAQSDIKEVDPVGLIPFVVCNEGFVTEEGFMNTGKRIQMEGISSAVLLRNKGFCVCTNCGKVYWEGSHHKRAKENVAKWISDNSDSFEAPALGDHPHHESSSSELPEQGPSSDEKRGISEIAAGSQAAVESQKVVFVADDDVVADDEINDIVY